MPQHGKLFAEWFWTDRWFGSTAFLLPLEARGLYREMLTAAWRRGAWLPNDPASIRRATGVTVDEWDRCWPSVSKYWRTDGDKLVNETQLEIYAEAQGMKQRASVRGKRAAAARTQVVLEMQPPITNHQSPSPEEHTRTALRARFERWWTSYPSKVGKDAAWREWLRRSPSDDLTDSMIAAVEHQKASPRWLKDDGQYIPNPRTWLHQGRWQDQQPELASTNGNSATEPSETWWDECKRLHQLRCGGPGPHRSQMLIDRQRTLDARKEMR